MSSKAKEETPKAATGAITMDEIWVQGGRRLSGSVAAGGSKNATLPVLAATLLAPGVYHFTNVPVLKDISTMLQMLARFEQRLDGIGATKPENSA